MKYDQTFSFLFLNNCQLLLIYFRRRTEQKEIIHILKVPPALQSGSDNYLNVHVSCTCIPLNVVFYSTFITINMYYNQNTSLTWLSFWYNRL